jgi:pimeloyl-ACP methyl ester carboxylesterase
MAEDIVAVMDAGGAGDAFLMGYSMGGFLSMHVLMDHPDLLRKLVIGGVGATYLGTAFGSREAIAQALLEPDKNKITDPVQKSFREFAEQSGKDIQALAACMRGKRHQFTGAELSQSQRPVLVVCGEKDALTGPPDPLATAFADGRAVTVPKRDHMTTVGDKVFKQAVLEFFRK